MKDPILPKKTLRQNHSKTMAVIDIGSTAIRMTIADIDEHGQPHPVEFLQQSVSLGKDTFAKGKIEKATIEQCVKTLRGFGKLLQEYGITASDNIRAVATAAVREAANREEFVERMHIGSGITVDVIDASDAARLNYLGVQPFLGKDLLLKRSHALIAEIGGGSTEVCFLKREGVAFIQAYRLGSLRLREMLEAFHVPSISQTGLMEADIARIVNQVKQRVFKEKPLTLIALGGDVRFAASQILPKWNAVNPVALPVAELERFTGKVLGLSVQKLAHKYFLPYMEAETAGPALLFYLRLAKALHLKRIIVAGVSMRHGLFMEMGNNDIWTKELQDIIIRSALSIAAKYQTDIAHIKHVERMCLEIFDALLAEHKLGPRHRLLLKVAALLHDVGLFVNTQNHHKHSQYLIENCELFGLNRSDLGIVALIARYHRRTSPRSTHPAFALLGREDRTVVSKLAAILRVADALDHSHSQRIARTTFSIDDARFVISVSGVEDVSIEQVALRNKGSMFEDVFGMQPVVRPFYTANE
jgi:exopolyphosphatase/guanosine-5'-triphosphate,3'-diphosphate pyrophosphatase